MKRSTLREFGLAYASAFGFVSAIALLGLAGCAGVPPPSNAIPSAIKQPGLAKSAQQIRLDSAKQPFLVSSFGTVYAADEKFKTLTPLPLATPNGSTFVSATGVDSNGDLFVSNCTSMLGNKYAYFNGLDGPGSCEVGETDIYPQGSFQQPTVIKVGSDGSGGNGVAVAPNGRFVSIGPVATYYANSVNSVNEFNPGQTQPFLTFTETVYGQGMGFDATASFSPRGRDVYLGEIYYNFGRFPWGSTKGNRGYILPGGWQTGSFVDSKGNVFVALSNNFPGSGCCAIEEYAKGASGYPTSVVTNGVSVPVGIVVYKGNLYVANAGPSAYAGSVTVYHPGQTTPFKTYRLPGSMSMATGLSLSKPI